MASYAQVAKKLQSVINQRTGDGAKLVINTQQWYSPDKGRTITSYIIKQSITVDKDKPYRQNIELFRTYSQVQMVLWLRDYWYKLNNWEIPHDNKTWEALKDKYGQRKESDTNGAPSEAVSST